ncbi:MAG: GHMP kinase, partial [Planctomycetia bacterium]|nr:GHMP kinase [Planctomycetia bacterium]
MKTTHAYKLFVPGRLCLFGEHSDWAGGHRRTNSELEKGLTIVVGTNQGIHAEVRPHPDKLILHAVDEKGADAGRLEVAMQADALLSEARSGGFFSYAAGVAYNMLVRHHVRGLDINNYKTDLPAGKGLSSSAAICVLVARAFNRLYDLNLTVRGEMEAAYHGEITTPSRCGRMDQGCAYGNRPILMTFDADIVEVDELVPSGEIHIVIVDLHAKKDTKLILTRLNEQF